MTLSTIRHRPIIGGCFGRAGRYALATLPVVTRGLHAVRHLVIEPSAGLVISVADDKLAALAAARDVLQAAALLAQREAEEAALQGEQRSLFPPEAFEQPPERERRQKPISRRRREVFAKSGGRCCYCSTPLTLDGRWHIEHQLPRALGGLDDIVNLVAACAPCNLKKGDRTALEFVSNTAGRHDR